MSCTEEREREERGRRQQKRAAIVCALSGSIPLYETYSSLETEGQARRPSSTRAVVPEADKEISACVLHKGKQIGTEKSTQKKAETIS